MSEEVLAVAATLADNAQALEDVIVVGQRSPKGFTTFYTESTDIKTAIFLLEIAKADLLAKMLRA